MSAAAIAAGTVTAMTATSLSLGGAMLAGAIAGGLSSLVMTGSLTAALKGAAFGAITAGFAHGIGSGFAGSTNKVLTKVVDGKRVLSGIGHVAKNLTHSVLNGAMSKLQGGSFSMAFRSTFFSTGASSLGLTSGALEAGIVGGVSSELAGGEFARGFAQSFATHAYNDAQHGGDGGILGRLKDGAKAIFGKVKETWNSFRDYRAHAGYEVTAGKGGFVISRSEGTYIAPFRGEVGRYVTKGIGVGYEPFSGELEWGFQNGPMDQSSMTVNLSMRHHEITITGQAGNLSGVEYGYGPHSGAAAVPINASIQYEETSYEPYF